MAVCQVMLAVMLPMVFADAAPTEQAEVQTRIITVENRQDIRVVYDVSQDVQEAGIGKALYYIRGLLVAYRDMGVPEKALHISVVVHGAAAYWLLRPEAYQRRVGDDFSFNSNEQVVGELIAHGVSVEICYVTMKGRGWTAEDILPGVKLVHDGYTRIIDLQQRGYGYIAF